MVVSVVIHRCQFFQKVPTEREKLPTASMFRIQAGFMVPTSPDRQIPLTFPVFFVLFSNTVKLKFTGKSKNKNCLKFKSQKNKNCQNSVTFTVFCDFPVRSKSLTFPDWKMLSHFSRFSSQCGNHAVFIFSKTEQKKAAVKIKPNFLEKKKTDKSLENCGPFGRWSALIDTYCNIVGLWLI